MNRRLLLFLIISGTLLGALLIALDRVRAPRSAALAPVAPAAGRFAAKPTPPRPAPRNPWEAAEIEARGTPANAKEQVDPWGPVPRPAPPARREEKPEIRKFARVIVIDAGHLKADKTVIRLYGISAPEHDETCDTSSGRSWPCGARALGALRALLQTRTVECEMKGQVEQEQLALCRIGKTDLSNWLVRQGWAELDEDADAAYGDALKAAKKDKLGLWSDGRQARE